jgi:uncharacterized protein (TIGR02246 family)
MMRDGRRALKVLMLAVMVASCGMPLPAAAPEDNAAIRALALSQADAWNRHDAKAYAALFTADCDVVNVVGRWWNGRAELERELSEAHATIFKDSALTFTDVQVRFVTSQLAIAHMRWTMTGAAPPSGFPQVKQGIQTLVVQKQAGRWLIDAFQNTNAMPEGAPATKPLAGQPTSAAMRSSP